LRTFFIQTSLEEEKKRLPLEASCDFILFFSMLPGNSEASMNFEPKSN
jgi:hypothetical protein